MMTKYEMREAVAKLCGVIDWQRCPDYPNDVVAARAAVLVCCEKDFEKFLFGFHLLKIVRVGERKQTWTASKLAYYVAVARADQLCEALLRVKNVWEDGK